MNRQLVPQRATITPIDVLFCAVCGLLVGGAMYQYSAEITAACILGCLAYCVGIVSAYFRRAAKHHERLAKLPYRVQIAEQRQRIAELELMTRRPQVAVINRQGDTTAANNVVSFDSDVRAAFPAIAQRLLSDGANFSRNGLAGILSRSQVESLQATLRGIGLAETASNNRCYLTDAGEQFLRRYLPQ